MRAEINNVRQYVVVCRSCGGEVELGSDGLMYDADNPTTQHLYCDPVTAEEVEEIERTDKEEIDRLRASLLARVRAKAGVK